MHSHFGRLLHRLFVILHLRSLPLQLLFLFFLLLRLGDTLFVFLALPLLFCQALLLLSLLLQLVLLLLPPMLFLHVR